MQMPWEIAALAARQTGDPPVGVNWRFDRLSRGRLRRAVGSPCPYCGVTMNRDRGWNGPEAPSRDHRIPRARGGLNVVQNIIICCRRCNEDKGCLTTEEYTAVLAGAASRLDHIWNARRSVEMNRNNPKNAPLVQAVLARFPGAKIVEVRTRDDAR